MSILSRSTVCLYILAASKKSASRPGFTRNTSTSHTRIAERSTGTPLLRSG